MTDRARAIPASLLGLTAVLCIVTGALFLFFSLNTTWSREIITETILLTCIAWVAETQAVQFSKKLHISSANLPVLLGVFFLGPAPSALIASISIMARNRDKNLVEIVFNFVANATPVMLVAVLFSFLLEAFGYSSSVGDITLVFMAAGILAGVIWEVADFGLVSVRVNLLHKQGLAKLWADNFVPALPSQLMILAVGMVIAAIYIKAGITAAALFFVPILASQHVYKLLVQQKKLLAEQTRLSKDLMDMNIGLAGALIMLLDSKDHYTANHSAAVALYCRDMARTMGMSEDDQWMAHMAGLLHDLGKVGTPDAVLKKQGELTPSEWEQIKEHPETAADVLSQLTSHKEIAKIIRHHQEHFDGSGYPDGLAKEAIPEFSRMLAVADTYHALTSDRPYRPARSPFEALIILRRVSGTQLDPVYVETMAQVLTDGDVSYREGSKADFLTEFMENRPSIQLDNLRAQAEEH